MAFFPKSFFQSSLYEGHSSYLTSRCVWRRRFSWWLHNSFVSYPSELRPAMQLPVLYTTPHNDIVVHRGTDAAQLEIIHSPSHVRCCLWCMRVLSHWRAIHVFKLRWFCTRFIIISLLHFCLHKLSWYYRFVCKDLCEKCEAQGGKHDDNHVFLKINFALPPKKRPDCKLGMIYAGPYDLFSRGRDDDGMMTME